MVFRLKIIHGRFDFGFRYVFLSVFINIYIPFFFFLFKCLVFILFVVCYFSNSLLFPNFFHFGIYSHFCNVVLIHFCHSILILHKVFVISNSSIVFFFFFKWLYKMFLSFFFFFEVIEFKTCQSWLSFLHLCSNNLPCILTETTIFF